MNPVGMALLALALAATGIGCAGDEAGAGAGGDGGSGGGDGGSGGSGGGEPLRFGYVTSELRLPATSADVRSLGFDLDGNGSIDNALGNLLVLAGGAVSAGDAVASGAMIQLHVLETPSLADADHASWTVYRGEPSTPPDYSGHGTFTVAEGASGTLAGAIAGGTFRGGPAPVPISLPFGDGSVPMEFALERVAVQAAVTAEGCEGKLGGAIPSGDFETQFVPAVALAINTMIAADPNSTQVAAILALLDTNDDRVVDADELLANPMFAALARPDVDLDGDGATDAFGIGLGFACVSASFDVP
jgi:hypothetical protein